jgi:molybdenum cofactor cytidylyltransferase
MTGIAAIVLAAGQGTRFGPEPKLLALLRGKPLVRHVAEAALGSTLDPVIVVTGHRAGEVEAALVDLPLRIIRNTDYEDGLSTSLRAGLADCPAGARAAVVLLGDMPLIRSDLIDSLVAEWDGTASAVIPVHHGRRGNPVLLSRALFGEIEALRGDSGAGALLRGRPDVVEVPVGDPSVLHDVDTVSSLNRLV